MVNSLLPVEIAGLTLRRRGRSILGPVSARIEGPGITIVMGPNGAGKSSLLRALHGLERISAGTIRWPLPEPEARQRQAFVFQHPTLLRRSVLDNIAYPLRLRGQSRDVARTKAGAMAAEVGLSAHLGRPAQVLSGGERQKLALARAMIVAPDLLFLDEPCANLDPHATREIEALLLAARARGTRLVMATHDLGQARRLADEVWFLHQGRLCEATPAPEFFAGARSAEAQAHLRGELIP